MATPVKFTFDNAFDGGASAKLEAELDTLRAEMEVAKNQAFQQGVEQGFAQGHDEAMGAIERNLAENFAQVQQTLLAIFESRAQFELQMRQFTAHIAYVVGQRLATNLMAKYPLAEIEPLVTECLADIYEEPRVLIRVHPELVEPMKERVEPLKMNTAFQGEVIILGEPSFTPQDVRVEWPNGGAERDMNRTIQQIEEIVARFIQGEQPQNQPNEQLDAAQ